MSFLALMLMAFLLELAVGWPRCLYARVKHPVVWIGWLISLMDRSLNDAGKAHRFRQWTGAVTTLTVVVVSTVIAFIISYSLPDNLFGFLVEVMIASSLLASRSLYDHVNAVAMPLSAGHYADAREALQPIVGRDTASLDESGVAGAAIESLAENASDGVFAPLFWGLLLGLPGITAYKAINTLDSMVGHRSEKYLAFGLVAAKLDDVVNLLPSRLSAVLIAVVGGSIYRFRDIAVDAKRHRSPNAGWPEGAMAYALQIRLAGPRRYEGVVNQEPWINGCAALPRALDLTTGLAMYVRSLVLTACLLVVLLIAYSTN